MKVNNKRKGRNIWQMDIFKTYNFLKCEDGRWEITLMTSPEHIRYLRTEELPDSLQKKVFFVLCLPNGDHSGDLGMKINDSNIYVDLTPAEINLLWGKELEEGNDRAGSKTVLKDKGEENADNSR